MHIDKPYKFLDLTASQELLNFDFSSLTKDRWSTDLGKILPTIFGEISTFSILFFHISKWHDPLAYAPEPANSDHPIYPLILNEIKKVESLYNASAKIAVLDGMPPGAKIYPHNDQSKLYDIAHRVHLPLVTDERVKFSIDNVEYHFKAGQFFEFNNKLVHSVDNNSDIFRIHLVIDLIPND
jgi:hypothetical protein